MCIRDRFRDVALYPAPISKAEALDMLRSLKSFKLLNGYRGGAKCDIDALCDTIVSIADFASANRDTLKELDINPLFVYPEGEGAVSYTHLRMCRRKLCKLPEQYGLQGCGHR